MIHFDGDKDFPQAPADLWARLTDAHFLVQCLPDVETVKQVEAEKAECVLRPGFSFVRGTLEITLTVAEKTAASFARLLAHGKGIGSTSTVEVTLTLAPGENGTRIHWTANIKELGGLLKAVPQGLIKASAQKVIGDVWKLVEAKLSS
jgi:carbon monoxide dehydrogenase subunit G